VHHQDRHRDLLEVVGEICHGQGHLVPDTTWPVRRPAVTPVELESSRSSTGSLRACWSSDAITSCSLAVMPARPTNRKGRPRFHLSQWSLTGDAERPRPSAPKDERGSEGGRLVLRLRPRRVRLDAVALCDLGALPVLLHLGYAQQEPRGCLRWTARLLRWLGGRTAPEAGDLVAGLRVTVRPEGSAGPPWVPGGVRRSGRGGDRPRCRVLGGLGPRDLDPGPRRAACAQVYGGPGTAQVTGSLGACTCRPSST
jgi:hypothetical protein